MEPKHCPPVPPTAPGRRYTIVGLTKAPQFNGLIAEEVQRPKRPGFKAVKIFLKDGTTKNAWIPVDNLEPQTGYLVCRNCAPGNLEGQPPEFGKDLQVGKNTVCVRKGDIYGENIHCAICKHQMRH